MYDKIYGETNELFMTAKDNLTKIKNMKTKRRISLIVKTSYQSIIIFLILFLIL